MTNSGLHEERRTCSAMSKQTGNRCRAFVAQGFPVCKWHGGRAPQVIMATEERQRARLAALVDPAITELQQLIGQADSDSVRLSAIKDILDRTGYKPTEKIQTTGDSTIRVEYADAATPTVTPEHRNGHV
jgi:hypothetical protein